MRTSGAGNESLLTAVIIVIAILIVVLLLGGPREVLWMLERGTRAAADTVWSLVQQVR